MTKLKKSLQNFGTNLKLVRINRGLSQTALARKCENFLGDQSISRYERGLDYPTLKKLAGLLQALDCDYSDLINQNLFQTKEGENDAR